MAQNNDKQSSGQKTAKRWLGAYGRFQAFFVLLFGLLFGVGLIVLGYKESKDIHTETVKATITKVNSCQQKQAQSTTYYCDFEVKYTVNNTEYTQNIQTDNTNMPFREGQTVTLYYDRSNPKDVVYLGMSPKSSEILLISIGVFALIGSIGYTVMVWKNSTIAAVGGAASLVGLVAGGGRRF